MRKRLALIVATPVVVGALAIAAFLSLPILYYGNMLAVIILGIKPTEGEIIGTYTANNDEGSAILAINANHTFTETVNPKRGVAMIVSGTWKPSGLGTVGFSTEFFPYIGILHDRFQSYAYGTPTFEKNLLGHISIEEDPDWGVYFYKESSNRSKHGK